MSEGTRIMIVDEDEAHRQELQSLLIAHGMKVVATSGFGIEAISLAQEAKPELVLLAVEKPVARPLQALESLAGYLEDTPIIAYSTRPEFQLARRIMQAGARDCISKPLRGPDLVAAIAGVMRKAVRGPESEEPLAGTIVTIFGAKGGIGKTTLTTNLACAIARQGVHSVLLIDLDTHFGDVAIMFDIDSDLTVSELSAQVKTLDRETLKQAVVRHKSGLYVLPAPAHPGSWRTVHREDVKALLELAAKTFDYVILDTPGSLNDVVGVAIELSRQLLAVTSTDIASIKDTALTIEALTGEGFPDDRIYLIVNHPNVAGNVTAKDVSRITGRDVFWEFAYNTQVALSTQVGEPIVLADPDSKAAQPYYDLAERLTGVTVKSQKRGGLSGLLRKD